MKTWVFGKTDFIFLVQFENKCNIRLLSSKFDKIKKNW